MYCGWAAASSSVASGKRNMPHSTAGGASDGKGAVCTAPLAPNGVDWSVCCRDPQQCLDANWIAKGFSPSLGLRCPRPRGRASDFGRPEGFGLREEPWVRSWLHCCSAARRENLRESFVTTGQRVAIRRLLLQVPHAVGDRPPADCSARPV